ncbi:Retron-type reverse transcriptase [Candidatus Methanoperedens nitroreducens]|uniref:Retron-type reverse transcriptase n=1 Tax=Candidatus Methanoperedens nitratireducens TaxID=1392998 RepID=A0A062V2C4_9EURY|nr:group II intron reverse transcriptase/maturase [Candidatus Methanoperedens nitroreducens]KCZ73266.1 Retron-type reverse transcriptase [Candidatus Methanoperedens nitroreducens]MDJ1422787.1 group II intron reverse transcriptase/maturase [Candidatus Methanoperedens sp.]
MKKWNQQYHDKFKEFALIHKVWEQENLVKAWESVRANKGSAGIDGVTIEQFEQNLQQNLAEIQRLLKENRYEPEPVKRVLIPKDNGKMRQLGIPTVRDRVVQQALKIILEPIFEEIFLPQSHGYRPNTDAHAAVRKAEAFIRKDYRWAVDADIVGFFDHVDHQIMMDLVCEKIADGRVLALIESFLKSGVMNEGVFEESIEGTPQGGNLSPLLSNIYLNHFDRRMGEQGFLLLRYADDIVIFCKFLSDAQDALKRATEILEGELKLKLSPEKTKIVAAKSKGVEFLGFRFNGRWRSPKDKAKKKFKEEIKRRTRRQQPINLETVIRRINPVIRGWGNYFKDGTVKTLYAELDGYIRGRLRSFKAKRRTWNTILYTLPETELAKMGLVTLSSLLNESVSCKGKSQTKAAYGKSVRAV